MLRAGMLTSMPFLTHALDMDAAGMRIGSAHHGAVTHILTPQRHGDCTPASTPGAAAAASPTPSSLFASGMLGEHTVCTEHTVRSIQ